MKPLLNKLIYLMKNKYILFIPLSLLSLSACGPFNQDNIYGEGHYLSSEDVAALSSHQPDTSMDYQAYQSNFVSISVDRVSYKLTQTLSHIIAEGSCFNPGFQYTGIYFNAVDNQGTSVAPDGMPYSTNIHYYPGTQNLQSSSITCSNNGRWSAVIDIPTFILYKLSKGFLDFSMVVWYKGQELHNDKTGVATVSINPPPLEDALSTTTQDDPSLDSSFQQPTLTF